jgi:hypothetical protein
MNQNLMQQQNNMMSLSQQHGTQNQFMNQQVRLRTQKMIRIFSTPHLFLFLAAPNEPIGSSSAVSTAAPAKHFFTTEHQQQFATPSFWEYGRRNQCDSELHSEWLHESSHHLK